MDISLLPQTAWLFMLIFVRLGTMVMLMPGIGEQSIPARIRLILALAISLIFLPLVGQYYPPVPASLSNIFIGFFGEFAIGFMIGLSARLILSALQIAGTIIAFQVGLGFAMNLDPTQEQQSVLLANFLVLLGIVLIFSTNLHHIAIAGLYDSYRLFQPGQLPPVADFLKIAIMAVSSAFRIGVQISAPFILFGLVFNLGLGILSRLMPQLQIFFIAMPASIGIGFILLGFLLTAMMTWYLTQLEMSLQRFLLL